MNVRGPWIEHLMQDEGLSYPDASKMLEGWDLIPCIFKGEHMATLLKKGAEVHFAIYKQYQKRYMTARRLRAFLLPVLESEGFLTTKLSADDKTERFITRLGFVEMGMDPITQMKTYIMTEIKPLEKTPCTTQP